MSSYNHISEDTQRMISALEEKYQIDHHGLSLHIEKKENAYPEPSDYYKSRYESRFLKKLPSAHNLQNRLNTRDLEDSYGFVSSNPTDMKPFWSFQNSTNIKSSFLHQNPQEERLPLGMNSYLDNGDNHYLQQSSSTENSASNRIELNKNISNISHPESFISLSSNSINSKSGAESNGNDSKFSSSFSFLSSNSNSSNSSSLHSATSNNNTSKSEGPSNYSECNSLVKNNLHQSPTKLCFGHEKCKNKFVKTHVPDDQNNIYCSENYSYKNPNNTIFNKRDSVDKNNQDNVDRPNCKKTFQMKITDSLKRYFKPDSRRNTSTQTATSYSKYMNDSGRSTKLLQESETSENRRQNSDSAVIDILPQELYNGENTENKNNSLNLIASEDSKKELIKKSGQFHKSNFGEVIVKRSERSNGISKKPSDLSVQNKHSRKRQSTFQEPFVNKKSKDTIFSSDISVLNSTVEWTDVSLLSDVEKTKLISHILDTDAVCMTLSFSDNSTMMDDPHTCEPSKKSGCSSKKVSYLAMKIIVDCMSYLESKKIFLFPLKHNDQDYLQWFRAFINDFMTKKQPKKIILNAKNVFVELMSLFINHSQVCCTESWFVLDPTVAAWLLNSEKAVQNLRDVLFILGWDLPKTDESSNWIENLNTDFKLMHLAMDSLKEKLQSQDIWELFFEVECPLISLLAVMEMNPIRVDSKTFITFSDVLKKKLSRLEEKAFCCVGHHFCLNSHPQLRQVLYEELQLDKKLPLKTKISKTNITHEKSTSEAMLNQLVEVHALPSIVLEYRQLQKLKSTYVDGMLVWVKDDYLKTHWDQTAAATGRLTSYQPNVQAIPKTSVIVSEYEVSYIAGNANDQKMEIFAREPYISHDGCLLLAADFQQIELRLLAHLSDDPTLLNMFRTQTDEDIFIQLTSQWLKKQACDVTTAEREQTKRVVYSVMYGVGKGRLSEYLKVSPDNAKGVMESFLLKFPAISSFTNKCVQFCQEHGYTCTIFNRRRQIPNINHPSYQLRAQAARQAVNFCVQGSAADLCKAAMLKVEKQLRLRCSLHTKLLIQIHDELLWEVPESEIDTVKDIVKDVMENCDELCGDMVKLKVPILISLSAGKSWAHLETCS